MKFSKAWRASKDRAKQRKYRANAPKHLRPSLRSAKLSDELVKEHGAKTAPVRVGDEVKIMRGAHAGKEGEVSAIHPFKPERVIIQGFDVLRRDGQKRPISFHASNLLITEVEEDDRRFDQPMTSKAKKAKAKSSPKSSSKPKGEPQKKTASKNEKAKAADTASATKKRTEKPGQQSGTE